MDLCVFLYTFMCFLCLVIDCIDILLSSFIDCLDFTQDVVEDLFIEPAEREPRRAPKGETCTQYAGTYAGKKQDISRT